MSTGLVRRRNARPTMMTKELKKRSKFTWLEIYKIYSPIVNSIAGIFFLSASIVGEVLTDGLFWNWTFWIGMIASTLLGSIGLASSLRADGKMSPTFDERSNHVRFDELRRNRAHRDDEISRLKELDHKYVRYSIQLSREGTEIVVRAVEHKWKTRWSLIPWRSHTTKKLYDNFEGRWKDGNEIKSWKIANPTVDKIRTTLIDAQIAVEELENKSYQEALDKYRLDVLAITMQPPPASNETVATVSIHEDTLEELLALEKVED